MMKTKSTLSTSFALACILLLSGCVKLWREHIERKTYLISAERTLPVHKAAKGGVLWIDRVNTLPPYNVRSFIIKKGESEYVTSYYSELLISPSENVRNMFFSWFSDSGLFAETTMHNRKGLTHRLAVSLLEMYGDDTAEGSRSVTVKLKAALLAQSSGKILMNKTYRQSVQLDTEEDGTEAGVAALNRAYTLILEVCEADMVNVLR